MSEDFTVEEMNKFIDEVCDEMKAFLRKKNISYDGSVFKEMSFAGRVIKRRDAILVRIVDKIRRLLGNLSFEGDLDNKADLLGYLILDKAIEKYEKVLEDKKKQPLESIPFESIPLPPPSDPKENMILCGKYAQYVAEQQDNLKKTKQQYLVNPYVPTLPDEKGTLDNPYMNLQGHWSQAAKEGWDKAYDDELKKAAQRVMKNVDTNRNPIEKRCYDLYNKYNIEWSKIEHLKDKWIVIGFRQDRFTYNIADEGAAQTNAFLTQQDGLKYGEETFGIGNFIVEQIYANI